MRAAGLLAKAGAEVTITSRRDVDAAFLEGLQKRFGGTIRAVTHERGGAGGRRFSTAPRCSSAPAPPACAWCLARRGPGAPACASRPISTPCRRGHRRHRRAGQRRRPRWRGRVRRARRRRPEDEDSQGLHRPAVREQRRGARRRDDRRRRPGAARRRRPEGRFAHDAPGAARGRVDAGRRGSPRSGRLSTSPSSTRSATSICRRQPAASTPPGDRRRFDRAGRACGLRGPSGATPSSTARAFEARSASGRSAWRAAARCGATRQTCCAASVAQPRCSRDSQRQGFSCRACFEPGAR